MRIVRVAHRGRTFYGQLEGESVRALTAAPWAGGRPVEGAEGGPHPLSEVELLVPCEPTKIVLVGQNYRKHAEELGKPVPPEPLLFLKPPSALNAHRRPIQLPPASAEVHHEAELGLVVGRTLWRVSENEALEGLAGLTCFNDVTARDIQRREVQFTRAKSYDTFACVGPWIQVGLSPADLGISCRVDGQVRQQGRTSDMIFPVARLVSFISQVMTLLPGDLISTGTPSGVGPLRSGEVVEVEVEGIGTLANPVEGEK